MWGNISKKSMSRPNTDLLRQRNEAICRDFSEMSEVRHLRTEHVLDQLQQKYYLQKNTIYRIVKSNTTSVSRDGI